MNGSATADPVQPKYNKGSIVTLNNTPNEGYSFRIWGGGPFRGDDFAVRVTGTITVPTDGIWTFGTNAGDGVRLKVDSTTVISDGLSAAITIRARQPSPR